MTLIGAGILAGIAVLFVRHVRATRARLRDREAVLKALKNLDLDIDRARTRMLVMRGKTPPTPAA